MLNQFKSRIIVAILIIVGLTNCHLFKKVGDEKPQRSYLDGSWNETSKEKALYFRDMKKITKKNWLVKDHFINGQIQMEGSFISKKMKKKNGDFIYCFENGNIDYEGKYINNLKEGEWKWYFKSGQMSAKEIYSGGKPVKIEHWNEDGAKVQGDVQVGVMPVFKYGNDSIVSYLVKRFNMPSEVERKMYGKVEVKFLVDRNGKVVNVKVEKSVHPLIDKEAIRVISSMPTWKPGRNHNRTVGVWYLIPIKID
jgi:TonB family protein